MCFYHIIVRYNIFNSYVKEIMENVQFLLIL